MGQEPVTIKVGEVKTETDSVAKKNFCYSINPNLGYDSFLLNGARYSAASVRLTERNSNFPLSIEAGFKYALGEKEVRSHAISLAALYRVEYSVSADLNVTTFLGVEYNSLLKKEENMKEGFYGPIVGLGFGRGYKFNLEAFYKYNFVNYDNDLNGSSVLLKVSYRLFTRCR